MSRCLRRFCSMSSTRYHPSVAMRHWRIIYATTFNPFNSNSNMWFQALHCMVLPPGEFNGIIPDPLSVYKSIDTVVGTVCRNVASKSISPMNRHDKPPPPSVGHEARFAVAQGHPGDPRMGSLKSPIICKTSYWSYISKLLRFWWQTNEQKKRQTEERRRASLWRCSATVYPSKDGHPPRH